MLDGKLTSRFYIRKKSKFVKKRYIKAGTNFSILHTYFDNLFMILSSQGQKIVFLKGFPLRGSCHEVTDEVLI